MAKRNKSDLVGNLINKRKMMGQSSTENPIDIPQPIVIENEKQISEVEKKGKDNVEKNTLETNEDTVRKSESIKENVTPRVTTKKKTSAAKKKLGEVGSILSDLKGEKKQDRYASIKIKSDLYNRIKKIARKEGIDRHGHLIDRVLTDFCERYEEK